MDEHLNNYDAMIDEEYVMVNLYGSSQITIKISFPWRISIDEMRIDTEKLY